MRVKLTVKTRYVGREVDALLASEALDLVRSDVDEAVLSAFQRVYLSAVR